MADQHKKPSNLLIRFAVGIPLGAFGICLLAYGNFTLLLGVVVVALFALREFWRLTGVTKNENVFSLSRVGDIASILLLWMAWSNPDGAFRVALAIFLPLIFVVQLYLTARGSRRHIRDVSAVVLGVFYIAGFLSFIFQLMHLESNLIATGQLEFSDHFFKTPWVHHLPVYPMLVSLGCDTSAFFAGKYFGKWKLAESISPKKTIEGLIGGMIGAASIVIIYSHLIGLIGRIPMWQLIFLGLMGGAISQLGDLTVSAMKREVSMKDSGHLLLAHGGMLDRIDGFLFAVPVCYLFFLVTL